MIRPVNACRRVATRHAKHLTHAEHIACVAYAAGELLELHLILILTSAVIAVAGGLVIILRVEEGA